MVIAKQQCFIISTQGTIFGENHFCSNPFCLKFRKALGPLGKTKSPNINTGNSTKTVSIIDTIMAMVNIRNAMFKRKRIWGFYEYETKMVAEKVTVYNILLLWNSFQNYFLS